MLSQFTYMYSNCQNNHLLNPFVNLSTDRFFLNLMASTNKLLED